MLSNFSNLVSQKEVCAVIFLPSSRFPNLFFQLSLLLVAPLLFQFSGLIKGFIFFNFIVIQLMYNIIQKIQVYNIMIHNFFLNDSQFLKVIFLFWASLTAQLIKNLPATQETPVQFLGQEDPLEKG